MLDPMWEITRIGEEVWAVHLALRLFETESATDVDEWVWGWLTWQLGDETSPPRWN